MKHVGRQVGATLQSNLAGYFKNKGTHLTNHSFVFTPKDLLAHIFREACERMSSEASFVIVERKKQPLVGGPLNTLYNIHST